MQERLGFMSASDTRLLALPEREVVMPDNKLYLMHLLVLAARRIDIHSVDQTASDLILHRVESIRATLAA